MLSIWKIVEVTVKLNHHIVIQILSNKCYNCYSPYSLGIFPVVFMVKEVGFTANSREMKVSVLKKAAGKSIMAFMIQGSIFTLVCQELPPWTNGIRKNILMY